MGKSITLLVDARPLVHEPAGVARYIENILSSLDSRIKIELISNRKIITDLPYTKWEYTGWCWFPGTLFIMLILPFLRVSNGKLFWGTIHAIPLFKCESVLTIHDLVFYDLGSSQTYTNRIMNKISASLSIKRASHLITVSKFTADRVIEVFKRAPDAIIRNSISSVFRNHDLSNENLQEKKFILTTGTLEPRKNLFALVEAFIELKARGYGGNLVVVGKSGWKSDKLFKIMDDHPDVKWTGYITDEELAALYKECDLFVFPSLYEGFGIPPLEALGCGARVLCTQNCELPNLGLNNIQFFDPKIDKLDLKILECLEVEKSSGNVIIYTWKDEAAKFTTLIENRYVS